MGADLRVARSAMPTKGQGGRGRDKVHMGQTERMIRFLRDHFRYDTMNSWNASTSYARCIKVHRLGLDGETADRSFDMLQVDEAFLGFRRILAEFDRRHDHRWQIGTNGRSGGYLVLYRGGTRESPYRSYCLACGQENCLRVLNFMSTPEDRIRALVHAADPCPPIEDLLKKARSVRLPEPRKLELIEEAKRDVQTYGRGSESRTCGRCREDLRVNYDEPQRQVFTYPGKGVDMENDFESWTLDDLRDRVEVVKDFDRTCDRAVKAFARFATSHHAEETEVLIPKTVTVAIRD